MKRRIEKYQERDGDDNMVDVYRILFFRRSADEDTGVISELVENEEVFSAVKLDRHIQRLRRKSNRWIRVRDRIAEMEAAGLDNVDELED